MFPFTRALMLYVIYDSSVYFPHELHENEQSSQIFIK